METVARTVFYNLRSSMTLVATLIVIVTVCCPVTLGMPYLDSDSFDQIYQDSLRSAMDNPDSEDVSEDFFGQPSYALRPMTRMIGPNYPLSTDSVEDEEEDNYDYIKNPTSSGVRAKRLGYSYFPFRYTQHFMRNEHRQKPLQNLLQEVSDEYPAVKRRLAFTALRGR